MALIDNSKVTDKIGFVLNGKPVEPGGPAETKLAKFLSDAESRKKLPRVVPKTPPARPRDNPNVINVRVG